MISVGFDVYPCAAAPLCSREVKAAAARLASAAGSSDPCIDLLFTHDGHMKKLNKRFLGMEGPTNVLSFPGSDTDSREISGHLVINIDAVRRESLLYGQDPELYLFSLMVHGMLHLAGHEHGKSMDEAFQELMSALS